MAIPPAKRTTLRALEDRRWQSVALGIVAVSPALVGLFMFLVTPRYFRPMFESVVGWLLLGIVVVTIGVGYALLEVGIWLIRRATQAGGGGRRPRKGPALLGILVLLGYSITWLFALWTIMLGPAVLILLKPRS